MIMILSLSLPSFSSENEKKGEVGHSSEHPAWTFHPCVLLCKAGWELLVQALCVASHPLGAVPFTVISDAVSTQARPVGMAEPTLKERGKELFLLSFSHFSLKPFSPFF